MMSNTDARGPEPSRPHSGLLKPTGNVTAGAVLLDRLTAAAKLDTRDLAPDRWARADRRGAEGAPGPPLYTLRAGRLREVAHST
jgi:hypothetical protein